MLVLMLGQVVGERNAISPMQRSRSSWEELAENGTTLAGGQAAGLPSDFDPFADHISVLF
jgi:hypothetical protein